MSITANPTQRESRSTTNRLVRRWLCTVVFMIISAIGFFQPPQLHAATRAQIDEAVANGITWLLADQNSNGSFGKIGGDGYTTANTGFAVAALIHHAEILGKTPLGTYTNKTAVQSGLNYLFSVAVSDGAGIYWNVGGDDAYQTGIPLMAVARSGAPTAVVSGGVANGMTYKAVAQSATNWLASAQDTASGGWGYTKAGPSDDQSTTGWAAMGIGYAVHSMGCTMPANVITRLTHMNSIIQYKVAGASFGGAQYHSYPSSSYYENTYKTGHLIYDLGLTESNIANGHVSGNTTYQAVQDALKFLDYHWFDQTSSWSNGAGWRGGGGNATAYNAMFSTSKGLNEYGIKTFTGVNGTHDWYDDFTTVIYNTKIDDGGSKWHWLATQGLGDTVATRATSAALLTLLKASSNPLPGSIITPPTNARYGANRDLVFVATFTDKVIVTGTPRIKLDIGGVTHYATYVSGSDSVALTFRYTTVSGDNDLNGIASIPPIELNGGTMKDTQATPLDVPLTFTAPDTTGVLVDTTSPTISSSSVGAANMLENGTATLSYTFSEPVSGVTAANFAPLTLTNLSGAAIVISATPPVSPACSSGSAPCATWNVLVTTGAVSAASGTLKLNLANGNNIVDTAVTTANAMVAGSTFTGGTVTVYKTITIPSTLPMGVLTVAYNNSVTASGGAGGYTYAVTVGAIPTGLTFGANGSFGGTPTVIGTYTFTIRATDSLGFTGIQAYSVVVVNTHNVTTSVSTGNGSISPSAIAVTHGLTTVLALTSTAGHHITGISGCSGAAYTPAYTNEAVAPGVTSYSYTTGAINADCLVSATTAINVYPITPSIVTLP